MTRSEGAAIGRAARAARSPTLHDRFWSKVEIKEKSDCWPWKAAVRKKGEGYGAFWYQGRHHPAPRISYMLANGVFETDLQICHRCDNPSCCNPAHLFLGTNQQNNQDKVSKGRHAFGEKNGNAKITGEIVREIRKARSGKTLKELEVIFGIDYTTISDICRRNSWAHIT